MKKLLTLVLALVLGVTCLFTATACGEELIGFDTELAEAVAEELGLEIEFKEINWDTKETLLETGSVDVVWNGFTYTTDRDNGYFDSDRNQQIGGLDFTNFYMKNKQVAVVKKANVASYTSNASFAGKRGCAEASSAGETVSKEVLGNTTTAGLEKQLDVFTGVSAGTYDYGVIDATMASEYVQSTSGAYNSSLAVVEISGVEDEFYAIAFKEGSNMVSVFNYALAKLFANGKAMQIAEKYGLQSVLYNGFTGVDTANFTYPTTGQWQTVKNQGKIIVGYTIFAPMNYFAE